MTTTMTMTTTSSRDASSYFNALDASNARAMGGSRASPRASSSIPRSSPAWVRCGIFYARRVGAGMNDDGWRRLG